MEAEGTKVIWYQDTRSVGLILSLLCVLVLGATVVLSTFQASHAPTPWETRGEAHSDYLELRERQTATENAQHVTDTNITNQLVDQGNHLDADDEELARLATALGLKPHRYRKLKH